jgi:hypothetical protein
MEGLFDSLFSDVVAFQAMWVRTSANAQAVFFTLLLQMMIHSGVIDEDLPFVEAAVIVCVMLENVDVDVNVFATRTSASVDLDAVFVNVYQFRGFFRFDRPQVVDLANLLGLTNDVKCDNGSVFPPILCLLVGVRAARCAHPFTQVNVRWC